MTAWNLAGKRFGKLTVIKRVEDNILPGGLNEPVWLCKCDCGNHTKVRGAFLRNGHTKSCGCLKNRFRDLTNQKFNGIKAIRPVGIKKNGGMRWLCRCYCGNYFVTRGSSLTSGHTKSCGCLKKGLWWKNQDHMSNAEFWIRDFLKTSTLSFKQQVHFKDLVNDRTGYSLSYDFEVFSPMSDVPNLLIEVQGPHHYFPFSWAGGLNTFKQQKHKDKVKYDFANNHSDLTLLEIPNPKYAKQNEILIPVINKLHMLYNL